MAAEGIRARLRRGNVVIVALLVLTAVEVWVSVAVHSSAIPYLAALALAKATLIVNHFMHLPQLWRSGGEEGRLP